MGLFRRDRIKDGRPAEARVLRMAPAARAGRTEGRLAADHEFVLEVEGREVEVVARVPHDRPLAPGQTVPVSVSAGDPQRVRIEFGRMPSAPEPD